jgi:hypothetical protein
MRCQALILLGTRSTRRSGAAPGVHHLTSADIAADDNAEALFKNHPRAIAVQYRRLIHKAITWYTA